MSNFESLKSTSSQAALSPLLVAAVMRHLKTPESSDSVIAISDDPLVTDGHNEGTITRVFAVAKGDHAGHFTPSV